MSTVTLAIGRPTLADRIFSRSLVTDIVLVVSGAALTALTAQIFIPLQPVPITGATFAVLLVGGTLGATRGAIALALYALVGLVGVPVFTPNADGTHTVGPAAVFGGTGGYIIGFIAAAALVGWLAQRRWDHVAAMALVAFLAGSLVIYAIGVPWLAAFYGMDAATALKAGLYPFIVGDVIKALLAAVILPTAWSVINRADAAKKNDET
jgi:biotin transport system substrate-specific component